MYTGHHRFNKTPIRPKPTRTTQRSDGSYRALVAPEPTRKELIESLLSVSERAKELAQRLAHREDEEDHFVLEDAKRIAAVADVLRWSSYGDAPVKVVIPEDQPDAWIGKRYERQGMWLVCHVCEGSFKRKMKVNGWEGYHRPECTTGDEGCVVVLDEWT